MPFAASATTLKPFSIASVIFPSCRETRLPKLRFFDELPPVLLLREEDRRLCFSAGIDSVDQISSSQFRPAVGEQQPIPNSQFFRRPQLKTYALEWDPPTSH